MSNINVLIVDDNEVDVKLIQRILKRSSHNCTVWVAENGQQALELYQQHGAGETVGPLGAPEGWPPALVLLDINMPLMNGFEFLHALKEMAIPGLDQKLYILSSSNANVDRERSTELQMVSGYLVKPVSKDELLALLDTLHCKSD